MQLYTLHTPDFQCFFRELLGKVIPLVCVSVLLFASGNRGAVGSCPSISWLVTIQQTGWKVTLWSPVSVGGFLATLSSQLSLSHRHSLRRCVRVVALVKNDMNRHQHYMTNRPKEPPFPADQWQQQGPSLHTRVHRSLCPRKVVSKDAGSCGVSLHRNCFSERP